MSYSFNREEAKTSFVIDENGETLYLPPDLDEVCEIVGRIDRFSLNQKEIERQRKAMEKEKLEKQKRDRDALMQASFRAAFPRKLAIEVAEELCLDLKKVLSKSRSQKYVEARALIYILLRERDARKYSYPHIGKLFGGRDHSTIIHSVREFIPVFCKRNPALYDIYKALGGKCER